MADLHIAFLWHMHQPNYRDPIRGYYSMPWVRLHAVKAYYDMAVLAGRYPGSGLTINLVPSLLEQLVDYDNGAIDYELMLSRKDPVDLSPEDKEAILSRFFQAHTETMIRPLPRYMELLHERGVHGTRSDIDNALRKFAAQDYLDLQVLFNLAWFGFAARDENIELKKLIRKGRFYTVDDRDYVLERQADIVGRIIPLYRKLWSDGAVDLSASPYYHPILPLLCDTGSARAGMPGCLLPKRTFKHPEDAVTQVSMGLNYFEEMLGARPAGMWPSEGSVSPEALAIIRDAGIRWAATDEEILAKSVNGYKRERDLYRPWDADGLAMFFRDHTISDTIGFIYSRNPADVAVDDFIARLKSTAPKSKSGGPGIVSVILDGENPWEYYPNSGRDFLETLYQRLAKEKTIKPVTFTDYLADNPPSRKIESIFPGSWINGNYDTWMGDQEEADGWDALVNVREALTERESKLSDEDREEAWLEIYRAEGSDWFWWYGEDHSSPNDPEFDRLFRAHVERVYNILKMDIPEEITNPIIRKQLVRADAEPTGLISPVIDGRASTFYEWLSAGWVPTSGPAGAMSGGEPLVTGMFYGFDLESFYLRVDFTETEEPRDYSKYKIAVILDNSDRFRAETDLAKPETFTLFRRSKDRWVRRARRDTVALGHIFEIGVRFEDITVKAGERVNFVVTLFENDVERERWPMSGSISFVVPDVDFESRMWQV